MICLVKLTHPYGCLKTMTYSSCVVYTSHSDPLGLNQSMWHYTICSTLSASWLNMKKTILHFSHWEKKKFNLSICRHYPELSHHLCKPVRAGGVWVTLHLHSLRHHLVLCGPGGCPALWPAVCLQHHSGEYNWTATCSAFIFFTASDSEDLSRKLISLEIYSLWKSRSCICCHYHVTSTP